MKPKWNIYKPMKRAVGSWFVDCPSDSFSRGEGDDCHCTVLETFDEAWLYVEATIARLEGTA